MERNGKENRRQTKRKDDKDKNVKRKKEKPIEEEENFEQNKEPFAKKWMNLCFQKLIFPNPNCVEVMEKLSTTLPRHLLKMPSSKHKRQALFLLLGDDFVEHHFPGHERNPEMLYPPNIDSKQRAKYISDMRAFMGKALLGAMEDCDYSLDLSTYRRTDDEMGKYVGEIKGLFKDAFDKQVPLDAFDEESKKLKPKSKDRSKPTRSRGGDSEEEEDDDDDDDDADTILDGDPTYTQETDAAGRAFVDFMAYDDTKREDYKDILKWKQVCLPLSLRQYFWSDFFETKEKARLKLRKGDNFKGAILRDFEDALAAQMKKQNIRIASKSANEKDINLHVVELFDMCPPLKELNTDDMMMKTIFALNIVDIHSDNYTPVMSLLTIPLQFTHRKKANESTNDHVKQLALQLALLSKYGQLSQKEIFELADEVIEKVKAEDPDYLDHITHCLSMQSNRAQPLDFPPEVFLKDTRAGLKVFKTLLKRRSKGEDEIRERYMDELASPNLFVRKWIGQAFVGVLSLSGMMWAWDQLFLSGWSRDTVRMLAVAVLALIKPWMLRASMYSGARKVFIEEPSKLYTSDLREALRSLQQGKIIPEIPNSKNFVENSKHEKKSLEETSRRLSMSSNPGPSTAKPRWLAPVRPFGSGENFELTFDLQDDLDDDNDDPPPVIEPRPDSESEPEEEPQRVRDPNETPTPPDSPPPPLSERGWVPTDPDPINPPEKSKLEHPFELYVDYIRFLPDNIQLCKITGRIINSGLPKGAFKDLMIYPLQESFQRSPTFKYKQVINPNSEDISSKASILFKVYGYQKTPNDIVIVGSCLIDLFQLSNGEFFLNAGGHQVRLRHGSPPGDLSTITGMDMSHNSPIPGASLCMRLLKADKIYDPTPRYDDGYYESSAAKPTPTEIRLFYHYTRMEDYSTLTVGDELRSIRKEEREKELENGPELQKYMAKLLDHSSLVKKRKRPISDMNYSFFAKHEEGRGVNVCLQGAFGLPESVEGYYTHAFGEVLPSRRTKYDITKNQMKKMQVVTRRLDLKSPQRSPDWLDLKTTLYPPYDEQSMLLVQIFGIKLKYIPTNNDDDFLEDLNDAFAGKRDDDDETHHGTIQRTESGSFDIDYELPLAWSVMPIFKGGYVQGGLHLLAVFEGSPSKEVLSVLQSAGSVEEGLQKCVDKYLVEVNEHSLLEVELYDGHVEPEDLPEPAVETQLTALRIRDTAVGARKDKFETTFAQFVLESLSFAEAPSGPAGDKYEKESFVFQREANLQFILSLNKALEAVGKPGVPI